MNLGLGMSVDMRMEQKLSPQMIQSLKLLQVSALELDLMVKQELETNPVLEIEEEFDLRSDDETSDAARIAETPTGVETPEDPSWEPPEDPSETPGAASDDRDGIDWETYFDDGFDIGYRQTDEKPDPDDQYEVVPVHQKSLDEALLEQLQERRIAPDITALVTWLIGNLNENGYLEVDLDDAVKRLGTTMDRLLEGIEVLQALDPAGIGARDLRECLRIQLRRRGREGSLAWRILHESYGLLQRLKIPAIARKFDTTPEEIQTAIREIAALDIRPGRQLVQSPSGAVVPDLLVEKDPDGQIVVSINDRTVPSLRISRSYQDMLRRGSRATNEEKKFVRDKLASASWLIRSIEQRKGTMLRVMHAIVEAQPDFFDRGPGHLRPLVMQQVADRVSMHISTVSRVTNEKYAQTSWGVFELKSFFTASVLQDDGTEISSVEAREAIARLVDEEDRHNPLSDQRIVEELKSRGIEVARRTVAKYRDLMGILPARMRRTF